MREVNRKTCRSPGKSYTEPIPDKCDLCGGKAKHYFRWRSNMGFSEICHWLCDNCKQKWYNAELLIP